jgi:hypothetical protein
MNGVSEASVEQQRCFWRNAVLPSRMLIVDGPTSDFVVSDRKEL